MAYVTESFQDNKLKKYGIAIKTKYIVGNKILERRTDKKDNDDIKEGIICEKEYYLNNVPVHKEKVFDSRIEYTFISNEEENKDKTCPNCGMVGKVIDFIDGCPYCKTNYNLEYTDKDLGSKYHYDRVLKSNLYRIIVAIIDFIISIILSYFFIKNTSRTFNNIDIIKIFVYGSILSLILYYFFYLLDAYIILGPIKNYKDKQNIKQRQFWERTGIDKKKFFNNLNYELRQYYYNLDNIVDYDIIDIISYKDYRKNNKLYVDIVIDVRLVLYKNNKIISKNIQQTFTLFKHNQEITGLKSGDNIIKCPNCGANIDVTKSECSYCHSKRNYLQEWMLEKGDKLDV